LIEIKDIIAFINNVIAIMKTKKEHDKIVEKILKIITENNLLNKKNICERLKKLNFEKE